MAFATILAARNAADRFEHAYGSGCYRYDIRAVPRGFEVRVLDARTGTFLTFV